MQAIVGYIFQESVYMLHTLYLTLVVFSISDMKVLLLLTVLVLSVALITVQGDGDSDDVDSYERCDDFDDDDQNDCIDRREYNLLHFMNVSSQLSS